MKMRLVDLIWLALLCATAFSAWLGGSGVLARPSLALMALVFGLAWLKGVGVLLEFMELRHAPPTWRRWMIGALTAVVALILGAYALSL